MRVETITYTDYNGNERTEDFLFNLSRAELMEMEVTQEGGMEEYIARIIESQNGEEIMSMFKTLIQKSYGVKTLDGKGFKKNKEILDEFTSTEAYVELFMKLATNAEAAGAFIRDILPEDKNGKIITHIPKRNNTVERQIASIKEIQTVTNNEVVKPE